MILDKLFLNFVPKTNESFLYFECVIPLIILFSISRKYVMWIITQTTEMI